MKKTLFLVILIFICNLSFANTLFFELGSDFLYQTYDDYDDFSWRKFGFWTNLDRMINENLFFYGNVPIYESYKYDYRFYSDDDEYLLPGISLGVAGYMDERLRVNGSFTIDSVNDLSTINISFDYLLRMNMNGLLMSAQYVRLFGDYITSLNGYVLAFKYRYGDRDQTVRGLQHRVIPSMRQNYDSRVFFEFGPDYTLTTQSDSERYLGERYEWSLSEYKLDIDANIDVMINPNLFILGNTRLYRTEVWKNKNSWSSWNKEDSNNSLFPFYSLGIVGYFKEILRLEGTYSGKKIKYLEDYGYDWGYVDYTIESFIFSGNILNSFNVHGLTLGLSYKKLLSKEISDQNNFELTFSYRFGDRDRNVRDAQHRIY